MLWVGSIRDAETRMKINLSPPSHVEPVQVAVRGEVEGVYRGSRDELDISALRLATNGSEMTASGSLAASSSMHFTLTSHNVKEWTPFLEAAYGASPLPFAVHGWVNWTGTATGHVSAPGDHGDSGSL